MITLGKQGKIEEARRQMVLHFWHLMTMANEDILDYSYIAAKGETNPYNQIVDDLEYLIDIAYAYQAEPFMLYNIEIKNIEAAELD